MKGLRIGNKELIKDINKALVIDQIRGNGPISRTDIAKNIELGLSTVTNITAELEEQNLIFEVGEGDSNGGRKPIFLEFNYNYGYVIGIKIEDKCVILALRNLNAELIEKVSYQFPEGTGVQAVLEDIKKGIALLLAKAEKNGKEILGIGIGISGVVDIKQGILLYSRLLNWENVAFKETLEQQFNIPVCIDNDVNTFALAELLYGAGKTLDNFVCVSIGLGVGAGIIINRRLYRGEFGGAGELGHVVVKIDGEQCYCGQKGCLENYASDQFIINKAKELLTKAGDTKSVLDGKLELGISDILKAAQSGDSYAKEAYREVGKNIGTGLANIINIFNPAAIILTGEGIEAREFIAGELFKYANKNYFANQQNCQVIFSKLGNNGWEIGAAAAAFIELFEAPIYRNFRNPW